MNDTGTTSSFSSPIKADGSEGDEITSDYDSAENTGTPSPPPPPSSSPSSISTKSENDDHDSENDEGRSGRDSGYHPSPTVVDLDSSSTFLWGASLLYYTGLPSPKVKEHQLLKTSLSMSEMSSRRSVKKSPSKNSGMSGTAGTETCLLESEKFSRFRESRCQSWDSTETGGGTSSSSSSGRGGGGLLSKLKSSTSSSLRLLKWKSRPSLSSFVEKSDTLPNPRTNKRLCEQLAAAAPVIPSLNSSRSRSSLKFAGKALRNSFNAARSLLPSTPNPKVDPSGKTSFKLKDKGADKLEEANSEKSQPTNLSPSNSNPLLLKKVSRLGRARKKFASTLSLYSSGSGTNASHKYKSASTLQISDSQISKPCKISSLSVDNLDYALEEDYTGLEVDSSSSQSKSNQAHGKGSLSRSKSPFHFMGKSKRMGTKGKKESGIDVEEYVDTGSTSTTTTSTSSSVVSLEKRRKGISLVKSIGKVIHRRRNASGEAKEEANKASGKGESEKGEAEFEDNPPEILRFDNEPKVRTPKVSGRRAGQERINSGTTITATIPVQDKDREILEVEVRETAIDISISAGTPSNDDNNDDQSDKLVLREVVQVESGREDNEEKEVEKIPETKSESSLITSLVILSSISDKTGVIMPTRRKMKGRKRLSSASSPENTTTSSPTYQDPADKEEIIISVNNNEKMNGNSNLVLVPDLQISSSIESELNPQVSLLSTRIECVHDKIESELLLGKAAAAAHSNDDNELSITSPPRRRKSSEDYKELRKNAIQEENGIYILQSSEGSSSAGEREKLEKDRDGGESLNDAVNPQREEKAEKDDVDSRERVQTPRRQRSAASECYEEQLKELAEELGGGKEVFQVDNNEVDNETDPETACTQSFRQWKPFTYELEPGLQGKKERLYKVLVVGELGAGKTSIIKRYVHQFFSQHYRATIGVDFALKVLRWDPETVVRLQLWDIAGQERFGSMTRVYYKEAVGAFVVFDVTRSATLEAVPKWKADLDAKVALPDGRPIPTVLLANKSDQPKEGIAANREKMNEFCQQQGFSAWFETSAKDNINIDESANFLVSKILEMDKWSQEPLAPDPDKLDLTANGKHNSASPSNCAC